MLEGAVADSDGIRSVGLHGVPKGDRARRSESFV
jgi:hypothetical protein